MYRILEELLKKIDKRKYSFEKHSALSNRSLDSEIRLIQYESDLKFGIRFESIFDRWLSQYKNISSQAKVYGVLATLTSLLIHLFENNQQ